MTKVLLTSNPLRVVGAALRGPEIFEGSYVVQKIPTATEFEPLGQIFAYNRTVSGGAPTYEENWTTNEPTLAQGNFVAAANVPPPSPAYLTANTGFQLVEMGGADAWEIERQRLLNPPSPITSIRRLHSRQEAKWVAVAQNAQPNAVSYNNVNGPFGFEVRNLSKLPNSIVVNIRRGFLIRTVVNTVWHDVWYLYGSYQAPRGGTVANGGLITRVQAPSGQTSGTFSFGEPVAWTIDITYAWSVLDSNS
jgi:hypothetical protein